MINNNTYLDPSLKKYLNLFPDNSDNIKIIPHILDLEKEFNNTIDPIIINKIPLKANFAKDILEYIANNSDKNSSDIISCSCGKYTGKYYENLICEECGTKICSNLNNNRISNNVWFSSDRIPLPNPLIFLIISRSLREKNSNTKSYLDYILDYNTEYPKDLIGVFNGKGFRYFYENFDFIINYFIYTFPKTKKRKNIHLLKILLEKYKDILFTTKLPIMSKFIQPITNSGYSLKYADESLSAIVKSIIAVILSKYTDVMNKNENVQYEKNLYRMYSNYISYIIQTIKTKYSKKKSYFRKNIFGNKLHFSFRNVIVPICTTHMGDEVHIPWGTGLTIFTYHIINIFTKRMSMSPIDAYNRVLAAYYQYDPIIDQVFQLLILESPFKGLPLLINRNPTLLPSGTFIGFITKVKPEITKISRQFINNFGRLDPNKNITTEFVYNSKEIYTSRKLIQEVSNGYDTLETVIDNKDNKLININIDKVNSDIKKILNGDKININNKDINNRNNKDEVNKNEVNNKDINNKNINDSNNNTNNRNEVNNNKNIEDSNRNKTNNKDINNKNINNSNNDNQNNKDKNNNRNSKNINDSNDEVNNNNKDINNRNDLFKDIELFKDNDLFKNENKNSSSKKEIRIGSNVGDNIDNNSLIKKLRGIEDNAMCISYIPAKLINMDYDGDKLDTMLTIENKITEEIINRIHPSAFFIGNSGLMEIKGKINIPRQHSLILNRWLNDI